MNKHISAFLAVVLMVSPLIAMEQQQRRLSKKQITLIGAAVTTAGALATLTFLGYKKDGSFSGVYIHGLRPLGKGIVAGATGAYTRGLTPVGHGITSVANYACSAGSAVASGAVKGAYAVKGGLSAVCSSAASAVGTGIECACSTGSALAVGAEEYVPSAKTVLAGTVVSGSVVTGMVAQKGLDSKRRTNLKDLRDKVLRYGREARHTQEQVQEARQEAIALVPELQEQIEAFFNAENDNDQHQAAGSALLRAISAL